MWFSLFATQNDHARILVSIPPELSVAKYTECLSKSTMMLSDRHSKIVCKEMKCSSWARGYYVTAFGNVNKATIKAHIRARMSLISWKTGKPGACLRDAQMTIVLLHFSGGLVLIPILKWRAGMHYRPVFVSDGRSFEVFMAVCRICVPASRQSIAQQLIPSLIQFIRASSPTPLLPT